MLVLDGVLVAVDKNDGTLEELKEFIDGRQLTVTLSGRARSGLLGWFENGGGHSDQDKSGVVGEL